MLDLEVEAIQCTRCSLSQSCNGVVFGVGNHTADLMVIGEAPGAHEDQENEPFVGRAGQLLTAELARFGVSRKDIYITNITKCRPPDNRDPTPEEIEACSPWLKKQIELVAPRVILCIGRFSSSYLLSSLDTKYLSTPLGKLRGTAYKVGEQLIVPAWHSAFILRNPSKIKEFRDDLKLAISNM